MAHWPVATALCAYERRGGAKRCIRIVERAGISLKSKLFSSNPWSKEGCSRTDCFPCKPGELMICQRENITYSIACNTCLQQGVSNIYCGESSRTLFLRGKEHWSAYLDKTKASVLHKHQSKHHPQSSADWKVQVYNYHTKPLRRQIEESVSINNAISTSLLIP